ncbi:pilus assembly protein PilM [Pseudomonas benzenivorans]|uniref:Pilus assembly protein PilM n=1 Tax=Pseudomonas benzenivorans TaxID=556533 RepID=A0ABY5H4J0_9PSED|nr:pilus assembly protein PilM [Pseudomonas benzenivorans]UTW07135.1 pilus assembly protein PilM [Pseudomonas benzenivorans]
MGLVLPEHNKARYGAIGLEFALGKLNVAQLRQHQGDMQIQACASVPYGQDREQLLHSARALKPLLTQLLRQHPFKGRRVVTTLPAAMVRTLSLNYRAAGEQGDAAVIFELLQGRLKENLDELVIDYIPTRQDPERADRSAIVAITRREEVIGYLELLRNAGLEVEGLEIGQVAIRRLITSLTGGASTEHNLVINFASRRSYITLISGRRLLFDHRMDFGEETLLQRLSAELQIDAEMIRAMLADPESADDSTELQGLVMEVLLPDLMHLAEEINRALLYAASELHGQAVTRVYMLGSLARWQGLHGQLRRLINIEVVLPDPLSAFADSFAYRGLRQDLCIATGLALRGLGVDA